MVKKGSKKKGRSRLAKKLDSFKKASSPEKDSLRKRLFADHHAVRAKKKKRRHYEMQRFLRKAGLDVDPSEVTKKGFYASLIISFFVTIVVIVLGSVNNRAVSDILIFLAGWWTAGFLLLLIVVFAGVAFYLDMLIHRRRKELEEVLPDYLQLVAANISAGMAIDRALWYAVRPRFGVLAKEIEDVAKRVLTGEELDAALRSFSEQYDSAVLQRSINLLLEGVAAGGKIADLLHKISTDITEQRILQQEMAANVTTYAIFISFAAVVAAPVLFGLSRQLLIVIQGIVGNIGGDATSGMLSVSGDVVSLYDFTIFAVVLLSATAVMSAMLVSIIRKGSIVDGLRLIPAFIMVSLTLFVLSTMFFGSIFGGLV